MDDQKIINLYWSRDERAISETRSKYGNYCTAISMNILANHEDAEECVNDTWLHAWNAMPPQRPNRLSTWLGKITRNLSLQRLESYCAEKRGGGQFSLALSELEECLSDPSSIDNIADSSALSETINHYLLSGSQEKAAAFIGRYYYFYSLREVANHLGISEGKAKSLLFRTRQGLKAYLFERGFS